MYDSAEHRGSMKRSSMANLSVIVPVYNAAPWLDEALSSIDYGDIIIVDDGSTDGSGDICEKYAKTIHTEHFGVAAARNRALEHVRTKFVSFCDADDIMVPGMLRRMESEMVGHEMVIGGFKKFGAFEQIVCERDAASRTQEFMAKYVMKNMLNPRQHQLLSGCWAKMYRSGLVPEFPNLTTTEDMAFNFDYLMRCKSVRILNNVVYNVRKHAKGSLTTTFDPANRKGLFDFTEGLLHVKRFLREFFPLDDVEAAMDNAKIYHAMLYFMRICAATGEPMEDVFKKIFP